MPNVNYTAILALANKKYLPGIMDNFFTSNPLLDILMKSGNYVPFDGHTVVQRLEYGEMTGVAGWVRGDPLTYDENIYATAAEFPVRYMIAPFVINKADEIETNGSIEGIEKALDFKIKSLKKTVNKTFENWLFNSTGISGDAKKIHGLPALFSKTNTYGGINRSTGGNEYWHPYIDNSATARPLTERMMVKAYTSLAINGDAPKLIITTPAIWNRYHEICSNKTVVTDTGKRLANLGFPTLEFMGIPVTFASQCPSGNMMWLNTDYIYLRHSSLANFVFAPFEIDGMDTRSKIIWAGNLTCSECRKQGLINNIDEAGY